MLLEMNFPSSIRARPYSSVSSWISRMASCGVSTESRLSSTRVL